MSEFKESASGDTYNLDHYAAGDEFYGNFTLSSGDPDAQFYGSISPSGGSDTSDYFIIDLKKSDLKPGDELRFNITSFPGSSMRLEYNPMSYAALNAYGPYSKTVLINEDANGLYASLTVPDNCDVLAFQVYNYSTVGGNYLIDMTFRPAGGTTRGYLRGVLNRAETFRVEQESNPYDVKAGNGDDFVYTGSGADIIRGGLGRDIEVGGGGADKLYGYDSDISGLGAKDGADQLLGNYGDDYASGGYGNDYINGEWDNDTLKGDYGNDLIYGGFGSDRVSGGDGNDQLYGASDVNPRGDWFGKPIVIDYDGVSGTKTGAQAWTIAGESQSTDASNDYLDGGAGDDKIYGGAGNDRIYGGTGDDLEYGGTGNDTIYADAGADRLYGDAGDDKFVVTETDGRSAEIFDGGDGIDTVDYSNLRGLKAGYDIDGLEDITNLSLKEVWRRIENVWATNADDKVKMDNGANHIEGNGGSDIIDGRGGNDLLDGGAGNDRITGGTGADTFVFHGSFGRDWIADFAAGNAEGHDVAVFDRGTFSDFGTLLAQTRNVGGNAVINAGPDTLTLKGVTKEMLVAADFSFV